MVHLDEPSRVSEAVCFRGVGYETQRKMSRTVVLTELSIILFYYDSRLPLKAIFSIAIILPAKDKVTVFCPLSFMQ